MISNFILALPALYYIFFYNKFFIFNVSVSEGITDSERFNIINKIAIISSIIFFHLLPFVLKIDMKKFFFNLKGQIKFIIPLVLFYLLTLNNFNFMPEFGGGGFFYKLSYILTNTDHLFLGIYFISLIFILIIINKKVNNLILIIIFIIMNPQLSIYHRYYDPLVLLTFLLFFNHEVFNKKFLQNNMIIILFFYTLLFNLSYILRNYI